MHGSPIQKWLYYVMNLSRFFSPLLARVMSPDLIVNYVPLTLFTVASFSSFDIEANKGNDRIGFLITLFLVMVSIASGITAESPGANEITYIGERESISML